MKQLLIHVIIFRIGVTEKGTAFLNLSVHSEGGHSSMPNKQSSIGILSNAIAKLVLFPRNAYLSIVCGLTLHQRCQCLNAEYQDRQTGKLSSRREKNKLKKYHTVTFARDVD